jgi:hypothetical protein
MQHRLAAAIKTFSSTQYRYQCSGMLQAHRAGLPAAAAEAAAATAAAAAEAAAATAAAAAAAGE